jgi:hypothetical protein
LRVRREREDAPRTRKIFAIDYDGVVPFGPCGTTAAADRSPPRQKSDEKESHYHVAHR